MWSGLLASGEDDVGAGCLGRGRRDKAERNKRGFHAFFVRDNMGWYEKDPWKTPGLFLMNGCDPEAGMISSGGGAAGRARRLHRGGQWRALGQEKCHPQVRSYQGL